VLYLYAVSQKPKGLPPVVTSEGIDGVAPVEAFPCEGNICWISRVARDEFADSLAQQMEDLEWLASASLRHQRVVAEIFANITTLPARFATIFLSEASVEQHVKERKRALHDAFERVAGADEWGIKIFAIAKRKAAAAAVASSGADYLKRKAELLQPRRSKGLDEEVRQLIAALSDLAVASSPGGKASAGQPSLLWHGSFLIRRKDRERLEDTLKRYATKWHDSRRIDWSGPWPPYSFVGEHAQ